MSLKSGRCSLAVSWVATPVNDWMRFRGVVLQQMDADGRWWLNDGIRVMEGQPLFIYHAEELGCEHKEGRLWKSSCSRQHKRATQHQWRGPLNNTTLRESRTQKFDERRGPLDTLLARTKTADCGWDYLQEYWLPCSLRWRIADQPRCSQPRR